MKKIKHHPRIFIAVAILFLAGCRVTPLPTTNQSQVLALKSYQIESLNLDYIARCKIRIKSKNNHQSSSCNLIVTARGELKLTLHHPLTGEIMVIYMNGKKMQIVDHDQKIFYDYRNTEESRVKFPEIPNFKVLELFEIMWGRKIKLIKSRLIFNFTTQGRPLEAAKKDHSSHLLVSFKKWREFAGIDIPQILILNDYRSKVQIKLAITEFTPGRAGELQFANIPANYLIEH
jgi:hypothetical protein